MAASRTKIDADEAVPLPFRLPHGDDDQPWASSRHWDDGGEAAWRKK